MSVNLRLEAADGSGGEEYRISGADIEVRRLRPTWGNERDIQSGHDWRPLTSDQLSEHVRDNTVVAQWLRHRIGWRRLLLKCADQETLERYGVHDSVSDRFAA